MRRLWLMALAQHWYSGAVLQQLQGWQTSWSGRELIKPLLYSLQLAVEGVQRLATEAQAQLRWVTLTWENYFFGPIFWSESHIPSAPHTELFSLPIHASYSSLTFNLSPSPFFGYTPVLFIFLLSFRLSSFLFFHIPLLTHFPYSIS